MVEPSTLKYTQTSGCCVVSPIKKYWNRRERKQCVFFEETTKKKSEDNNKTKEEKQGGKVDFLIPFLLFFFYRPTRPNSKIPNKMTGTRFLPKLKTMVGNHHLFSSSRSIHFILRISSFLFSHWMLAWSVRSGSRLIVYVLCIFPRKNTKERERKKKAYRRREKENWTELFVIARDGEKRKKYIFLSMMWKYFGMNIIQSLQIIMYSTLDHV